MMGSGIQGPSRLKLTRPPAAAVLAPVTDRLPTLAMRLSVEIRSSTAICSMPHRSLPSLQRDARYFRIQPVDDGYPALCHPHPASRVSCFQSGERTSEGRRRYRWLFGDLAEVGALISRVDDAPCIQLGMAGPLLSGDDRRNGANGAKMVVTGNCRAGAGHARARARASTSPSLFHCKR